MAEEDSKIILDEVDEFTKLIDPNHGHYYLQDHGDALVKTQKYLVPKKNYIPSTLGKESRGRRFLIKEDQFTDIGGGYATFVRHIAQMPKPWFSFEEKTALVYEQGGMMGINYDSFTGENAFGNTGFNYKGAIRRNLNYLAKATRYYVSKGLIDFYQANRYSLDTNAETKWTGQGQVESKFQIIYHLGVILIREIKGRGFSGSFLRPCMLGEGFGDNTFLIDPITKQDYPEKLFVNAPLGTILKSNNSECVIAPDRIRLWQPGIYEITRYTASINLIENNVENISVQVYWEFDEQQIFTQDEIDNIRVTLFAGDVDREVVDADPLNYYLYDTLSTLDEQNAIQPISVKIEQLDANGNPKAHETLAVGTQSVSVIGGEITSKPDLDFTEGVINVRWSYEQPKVIVRFAVTRNNNEIA